MWVWVTLPGHPARYCLDALQGTAWTRCRGLPGHAARDCLDTLQGTAWTRCKGLPGHAARDCLDTLQGTAAMLHGGDFEFTLWGGDNLMNSLHLVPARPNQGVEPFDSLF
jgi:hypothetical protein